MPQKGLVQQSPLERGHGEVRIQYEEGKQQGFSLTGSRFFRIIVFMLKWEPLFLPFRVTRGLDLLDLTLGSPRPAWFLGQRGCCSLSMGRGRGGAGSGREFQPGPTLGLREGGEAERGALPRPSRSLHLGCAWGAPHALAIRTQLSWKMWVPPTPPRFLPSGEKVNQTASSTTRKRRRHRARPPRQAPRHGGTRASRGGRGAGPGEDQHRLRGRWVRRGRAGVRPPALVQPRRLGHALRARELSPCVSINFLHFSLCLGRKPNKWSGSESMPCF